MATMITQKNRLQIKNVYLNLKEKKQCINVDKHLLIYIFKQQQSFFYKFLYIFYGKKLFLFNLPLMQYPL